MIRILLAEDDDAMRTYLARALEQSGYSVAAVDRGLKVRRAERTGILVESPGQHESDVRLLSAYQSCCFEVGLNALLPDQSRDHQKPLGGLPSSGPTEISPWTGLPFGWRG